MQYRIELKAENKIELNKLIDEKLKVGYLLEKGIYAGEKNSWCQSMTLPHNMEGEVTLIAFVKLVVLLAGMIGILLYMS